MQIEKLSLKYLLEKNIFIYGNNSIFINSFINLLKTFFANQFKFLEVNDFNNLQNVGQCNLFNNFPTCLIFNKVEDKNIEIFSSITKNFKFIAIQGNFLRSKKVLTKYQKDSTTISIPFFTNSSNGYIEFLLKNLGYNIKYAELVLNEYEKYNEDPVSIIQKLSLTDFKYNEKHEQNYPMKGIEPIVIIKMLLSYVKNSYGNMEFLLRKKIYSDKELLEKFINLELKYKKENLKSKIYISKEFL